jgi:hypothetical protein
MGCADCFLRLSPSYRKEMQTFRHSRGAAIEILQAIGDTLPIKAATSDGMSAALNPRKRHGREAIRLLAFILGLYWKTRDGRRRLGDVYG